MGKLLIIDGHNLLFRMFYGIPSAIPNSEGKDIRGVIGFVGGMLKALNLYDFDKMIVVFDSETSTDGKLEIDDNYKSNRVDYSQGEEAENPFSQLDYIYRVLEHLNVEYIEVSDYEADDYIASLCSQYSEEEIVILYTDRDFLQLVSESITVYSPRGKMSIEFTPAKVYEKFNISPDQVVDYKVLVGDKSDNIAGVKSIGPKTAVRLLNIGTLADILAGHTTVEPKLFTKLTENTELILRNSKLITMNKDIEINMEHSNLSITFDRKKKTMEILSLLGIN